MPTQENEIKKPEGEKPKEQESPEDAARLIEQAGKEKAAAVALAETEQEVTAETLSEKGIRDFEGLLTDSAFREQVLKVRREPEQKALEGIYAEARQVVEAQLKPLIEKAAMAKLGETDLGAARKRGKEWGIALKGVTEIALEISSGESGTMSLEAARAQLLSEAQAQEQFTKKVAEAQKNLASAQEREQRLFDQLRKDLEARQADPELREALETWGVSPDSKNNRGPEGKGFHAGIIHYFEYRQDADKNGRYKGDDPESFSLAGFIEYSKQLAKAIRDPSGQKGFAEVGDQDGQRRLYVRTEKATIIAFQRKDDTMRVISVTPSSDTKRLQNALKSELTQTTNERGYLNALGPERTLLEADEQTRAILATQESK